MNKKIAYCELSCYYLHFLYFWLNNDHFSLATPLGEFPGTIKRFWCIRYGTNIEVKIRDCPGAFGTDGGSANLPKVKIFSTLQLHHLILAFIIHNQIIFVYIHKYIHALYNIMNCSKQ